jgi:hypothetical protein
MIELINAKVGLEKVFLRAKNTLEELKEKHPKRKDIIEKQEDSLGELAHAKYVLHRMDLRCMSLSSELYRNNRMLLEMQTEIKELKRINQNLIDNATL